MHSSSQALAAPPPSWMPTHVAPTPLLLAFDPPHPQQHHCARFARGAARLALARLAFARTTATRARARAPVSSHYDASESGGGGGGIAGPMNLASAAPRAFEIRIGPCASESER